MAKLDRATAAAQREIELVREYRARLISDVVTGKLDVREAAAQLPDEIQQAEALDAIVAPDDNDEACGEGAFDATLEEAEA